MCDTTGGGVWAVGVLGSRVLMYRQRSRDHRTTVCVPASGSCDGDRAPGGIDGHGIAEQHARVDVIRGVLADMRDRSIGRSASSS